MLLPVLLVLFAILPAAVFAYGTEPVWASYGPRGLDLILWTQRFGWPLVGVSLLLCIALGVAVIAKRSSVIWLVGFIPVLALLFHRYSDGPAVGLYCVQDPVFQSAAQFREVNPNERVVGIALESQPYAFAYSALHRSPVVVASVRDQRVIVLWSEDANRAMVFTVARGLRADDLQIVSSPDDAILVYNTRLGQFINGVTGRTISGEVPTGFRDSVAVEKTSLRAWVLEHPDTQVMEGEDPQAFTEPQQPKDKLPGSDSTLADASRVCVVAATQPIAVPSEAITDRPLNLTSGQTSLLLVRIDGIVHAFNRELPADLVPRFAPGGDAKHKTVVWVDSDTNSGWSSSGAVVDGPAEMHGLTMSSIPVEEDLYWNVMKFWFPQLHLASDAEVAAATVVKSAKPAAVERKKSGRRKRIAVQQQGN